jgi:DnaK suppressor protein
MNFAARREALEERRQALSGRLGAAPQEARAAQRMAARLEQGWSRAGARAERRSAVQSALQELRRVEAALARLHEGSYGICLKCGDVITEERLDAHSDTAFCGSCCDEDG